MVEAEKGCWGTTVDMISSVLGFIGYYLEVRIPSAISELIQLMYRNSLRGCSGA